MYDSNQFDSYRYAQMQSSILNKTSQSNQSKSSSGGKINLNSKFMSLKETLDVMEAQLHQLSNDTRESLRYASQMNTDLIDRQLNDQKSKLNDQIKKLEKSVKYGITESQQRSEKVWQDCKNRIAMTQQLKSTMTLLRMRVSKLENTLGYYPVTQKVL